MLAKTKTLNGVSVYMTLYNHSTLYTTQNICDNVPCQPPDNHHYSAELRVISGVMANKHQGTIEAPSEARPQYGRSAA